MSEQSNNPRPKPPRKPQSRGQIPFGSSPLIAASAAARLVQSILARLETPHAAPTARPLSAGVLWKQVARRLGYAPEQSLPRSVSGPTPASAHGSQSATILPPAVPSAPSAPPVSLIWRARPVAQKYVNDDLDAVWQPARPSPQRPTIQVVGQPMPVIAPVFAPTPTQPAAQAPAQPVTGKSPETQPQVDSNPPGFVPATVIRVEYVPAPPVVVQVPVSSVPIPLVPAVPPIVQRYLPEPGEQFRTGLVQDLSATVNRDLVPTTDLLSRLERKAKAEIIPRSPQVAQTQDIPVPMAAPAPEIQPVEMPLTAQQSRSARMRGAQDAVAQEPTPPRGFLGRFVDRVVSVLPLPEAIRRALQPEHSADVRTQVPTVVPTTTQVMVPAEPLVTVLSAESVQRTTAEDLLPETSSELHAASQSGQHLIGPLQPSSHSGEDPLSALVQSAYPPESAPVTPEYQLVASAQPDFEAASRQEGQSVTASGQLDHSRGSLFKTIVDRLFGTQKPEQSSVDSPVSIQMPWVRRATSALPSISDEGEDEIEITQLDASHPEAAQSSSTLTLAQSESQAPETTSQLQPASTQLQALPAEPTTEFSVRAIEATPELAAVHMSATPESAPEIPYFPSTVPAPHADIAVPHIEQASMPAPESGVESGEVGAWEVSPEVAREIVRTHIPLASSAPIALQGSMITRILRRLGGLLPSAPAQEAFPPLVSPFADSVRRAQPASPDLNARGAEESQSIYRTIWPAGSALTMQGLQSPTIPPQRSQVIINVPGVPTIRYYTEAMSPGEAAYTAPPGSGRLSVFGGVLRSLVRMSPSLANLPEPAEESGADTAGIADYMEALEKLYGTDNLPSTMPLAVPFGSYATATERPSYFTSGDTSPSFNVEPGLSVPQFNGNEDYTEQIEMPFYAPSLPSSFSPNMGSAVGVISDYSWGDARDDGPYNSEANAWADVVATAVGGSHISGVTSPALALAGAERADPGPQRPPNEDKAVSPSLDDLADTVYSLIRERLAIEKERSFT